MCLVKPGPSLPTVSSAICTSTSTRPSVRFRYDDSSRKTSASEKGKVRLNADAGPSCAIRFCLDIRSGKWDQGSNGP